MLCLFLESTTSPIGVAVPDADAETLVAGNHKHVPSTHILHHHGKNGGKALMCAEIFAVF